MSSLEDLDRDAARRAEETSWPALEKKIATAMEILERRDRELLSNDDNERAVAHRLAVYLEQQLADDFWHVDCEFTRQGTARDHKDVGSSLPLLPPSKKNGNRTLVRPDIIVHRRGPDGPNLLVIEVKPARPRGDLSLSKDFAKLAKFQTEPKLKYTYAVLVTYRFGDSAGFEPMRRVLVKKQQSH